uniref:IQ motif containing with AAA domain 1 n=1 Tax=Malurus cyaneus samueli TaxID=2593467 RepID=A0A8C5U4I0_9PASS
MIQREQEEFSQPQEDREQVRTMLITSYIQYLDIIRKLEAAHDHIIHQQKRAAVRKVLDGAMGRLLEIKKEMVSLEKSECHNMEDVLRDLKRVPEDIEIPIPKYFLKENLRTLQEREKYLDEILLNAGFTVYPEFSMTLEEGIRLIQVAERARQGRSRAAFMKKIYLEEKRQAQPQDQTDKNPDAAATCIQKVWRGYAQRKKTERLREEEMIFLGMVSEWNQSCLQIPFSLPPEAGGETDGFCNFFAFFSFFWRTVFWENRDTKSDFLQDHDPELIKGGQREEVEEEIRVQVSISLPCRTVDDLYQQLAEDGLLIKVRNVNLSDFIGYSDCLKKIPREVPVQPTPSIPDVRQLVTLYGILPLGSQTVREKGPLVKSLLLAGPAGVGKKMLLHAICTETGANLFNITPSNIIGKHPPGKKGLVLLLHMVLKVGKELQPSVVWVGDAERMYQVICKRLTKLLPALLRAMKARDRMLLVGTSSRPFDANIGPFCKVYQKIILIPKPDYLTRCVLWRRLILQRGGTLTKLVDINGLAQVSDGFTPGHMVDAVQTVLTELRLLQMPRKPLRTTEFLTCLARHDPVYREEEETFQVTPRVNL